jgi:hypothetical protein
MPGADRILSPTRILNTLPNLCAVGPDGGDFSVVIDGGEYVIPVPPESAYGFHRQPDGTFAEPFSIHFEDDGAGTSFCFSFVAPVQDRSASIVFATMQAGTNLPNRPTATVLTLGAENVLGTYACLSGVPTYSPGAITTLPVNPATQNAGNTSEGGGYLWSDDETQQPPVALVAAVLVDGGFGTWAPLPLPSSGEDRRQPVLYGGSIYYYRSTTVTSTAWSGADPSSSASFGPPRIELAGESNAQNATSGEVVAVGQPTFADRPDGTTEMYFVYYRRTETGYDGQVGRVSKR